MAKSRAKGINAAWNEFYNSLPQEYKDYVMGGVAEYGESENMFKDAYNKFHPKGNRNKIGDYSDYSDTPEGFADIFFFQDPAYGEPDDETDTGNILYKAHPEMRENFLRLIAGTPEERAIADYAFDPSSDNDDGAGIKWSELAHRLYSDFPGIRQSHIDTAVRHYQNPEEAEEFFKSSYPKELSNIRLIMNGIGGDDGGDEDLLDFYAKNNTSYDDALKDFAAFAYNGASEMGNREYPKGFDKALDKLLDPKGEARKSWGSPEWKKRFRHDEDDEGSATQQNILNGLHDLS